MLSGSLFAQTAPGNRGIYFELFGASGGLGINYDARFKRDVTDGLGWRTGVGMGYAYSTNFVAFHILDDRVDTYNQMFRLSVPLEINYLLGERKSKFESGAGVVFCLERYTSDTGALPENDFGLAPYASVGYRLVTPGGFLLRVGALSSYSFAAN